MELTKAEEREVIAGVTEALIAKAWAKLESGFEDIALISIPRLAGMLDVSTPHAHRLAKGRTVDFGPRDARISLSDAKALVAERKVKVAKKGGRK